MLFKKQRVLKIIYTATALARSESSTLRCRYAQSKRNYKLTHLSLSAAEEEEEEEEEVYLIK